MNAKIAFLLACTLMFPAWGAAVNEYRLGAGDVVRITVYDHPDLLTEIQLTADGQIVFPLIGEVHLAGLTFTEASTKLAKLLKDGAIVNQPSVNVLVTQYLSQRVAVLGEVSRAGRFAMDGSTDLIDALALAGGITPNGGDEVVLVRGDKRQEFTIQELTASHESKSNVVTLQSGDVVYVPRLKQFYVSGEVNRPGSFRLEQHMTVLQAIAVGGGFTPHASQRRIVIHRSQSNGEVQEISARLSDRLQENDTVFVKESLF